jgi:hypothetical protein
MDMSGRQLDRLAAPTKNFWEAPFRPYEWKFSHQWTFLGAMACGVTYSCYRVLGQSQAEQQQQQRNRNQ